MSYQLTHDKTTDVAFIDIAEPHKDASISVLDVSEIIGTRAQVLARIDDESNTLLGLIIEDYPRFKREIRTQYVALAVERILELLVSKIKNSFHSDNQETHRITACAAH